jgi:hypothetical protein
MLNLFALSAVEFSEQKTERDEADITLATQPSVYKFKTSS